MSSSYSLFLSSPDTIDASNNNICDHDANVDLSIPEMPCYRDKGVSECTMPWHQCNDGSCLEKYTPTIEQIRRNRRITRKRSPGERPYSIIKGKFNDGHVHVTMVRHVRVKMMFKCLCYNLFTLMNLK